ncbi:MAG: bifunctional phosphoglucose/phosphomannose isomerase [Dehalococcoidales bacterium]|nr:bifunctional phosphoglucose/phosphomannose isomerase [Dehalococcoidales bacterium]
MDNARVYRKYDPAGMLACINGMAAQCRRAWHEAMDFKLPPGYSEINKVVISGMGGSAIGGDLLRSLVTAEAKVSIMVSRDYQLPAFVDARTLVVISSYSGNTEETLSSFDQALKNECKKLVITTGGKLMQIARRKNVPVFEFAYPGQPRAALGFSLLPIIAFLQRLGVIGDKSAEVAEMVQVLGEVSARMNEAVATTDNPAKQLAQRLYGKLPLIYGAGITAEVAHRWKTQLNENSKAWAFYDVFPELDHNAVVGYQFPKALAGKTRAVLLQAPSSPRLELRIRVTCQLLEDAGVGCETINATGDSPLSQVMSLVSYGDYVSYYLAILYKIDPTPVKVIDYLKAQLAKGSV